jgi:hypothetical protein
MNNFSNDVDALTSQLELSDNFSIYELVNQLCKKVLTLQEELAKLKEVQKVNQTIKSETFDNEKEIKDVGDNSIERKRGRPKGRKVCIG